MKLAVLPLLSLASLAASGCSADRAPASGTSPTSSAPQLTVDAGAATAATPATAGPGPDGGRAAEVSPDGGETWGGVLGLSGIGESGGFPRPIGLGSILASRLDAGAGGPSLPVRAGAVSVSGRLPPEVVERIVHQGQKQIRACYEQGLGRDPALQGRVHVRFVIGKDGAVTTAATDRSLTDLPDPAVVTCLVRAFSAMKFPRPEGGIVVVGYPLLLTPAAPAAAPAARP
jgi:hypothetical protein